MRSRKALLASCPKLDHTRYEYSLAEIFNFYNREWQSETYKKVAVELALSIPEYKEYVPFIRKANYLELRPVAVFLSLLANNENLRETSIKRLKSELENIKSKYFGGGEKEKVEKPEYIEIVDFDSTKVAVRECLGRVEEGEDRVVGENTNNIPLPEFGSLIENKTVIERVVELINQKLEYFEQCLSNKDMFEQFGKDKRTLQRIIEYYKILGKNFSSLRVVKPVAVKRKKMLTPAQQTKKMLVMRTFKELNLVGKPATTVVGSSVLFVYFPENRKLVRFVSQKGMTLGASGQSVTNYDTEQTMYKTVRNPKKFFENLELSKTALRTEFNKLSGNGSTNVPIRLNNKSIILA